MGPDDQLDLCTLTRRRLVLSATGAAFALSGCQGSNSTDDPESTAPPDGVPTGEQTTRASPKTTQRQEPSRTETPQQSSLVDTLSRSPSSHIAPADGFADPSWVDQREIDVVKVTNLEESGEGSLRWAVERPGPRLIVFEVGGVIDLEGNRLAIEHRNCWVAGHTAPPPGITVTRGEFRIDADECIVQHIRSRPGDADKDTGWQPDAITTSDGTQENIIDHCTASWSVDEVLSVGYQTQRTTVVNCLIAEPLDDATHPKGPHGYGSLTGNGASEVLYAGNIWAHATARNPRLKAETESVVANNVMYHFDRGTNLDASTVAAIHDNAYLRGGDDPHIEGPDEEPARASVSGNVSDGDVPMTGGISKISMRPFWPSTLETVPGEDVFGQVLPSAGARPADRDRHEQRVVDSVQNRTGSYIDSQSDVGGYPTADQTERPLAVPDRDDELATWLYQHRKATELSDASPP